MNLLLCKQGLLRGLFLYGLIPIFSIMVYATDVLAGYGVQIGAFARESNADQLEKRLQIAGFPVIRHAMPMKDGRVLTGITVGPYDSKQEAMTSYRKLKGLGWYGYVRRFDNISSVQSSIQAKQAPAESMVIDQTPDPDITKQSQASSADTDVLVFHTDTPPAPVAANDSEVLIFHDEKASTPGVTEPGLPVVKDEEKDLSVIVTDLRAEAGGMLDSDSRANTSHFLHAGVSARWNPVSYWEFQLEARADGYYQDGALDDDRTRADYGEIYARYRGDDVRVTIGSQNVVWGRIDEVAPTDRLSVQDLSRFVLDELPDRRRAVPALRMEVFKDAYKLDAVWIPEFREAELPDINSVWSPINKTSGQLRGAPDNAVLSQFITQGTFGTDVTGSSGGLRFSHSGEGLDYALTVQRFRHSAPSYEMNPVVRASYLGGNPVATAIASTTEPTFVEKHPQSWLYGGDIGITTDKATWRFELAYMSDVPATTTDFRLITLEGVDWMGGVEFHPGGGDTRVNLQLGGRHLLDAPAIFDRTDIYNFNGEIESVFANSRWRGKGRFSIGLDDTDIYLNPELAYLGFEPHEIYVSLHYFDGDSGTFGGFHQNDSLLTLGWRARY